jgi:hypothetical protein
METMTISTACIKAILRHRPGAGRTDGPRGHWLLAGMAASLLLLAGCVSDQELLRDSSRSAQEFVREHASREFGCPAVETDVTAGMEEAGQPLGDLLSEYQVTARGCKRTRVYDVVCDGSLCSLKE